MKQISKALVLLGTTAPFWMFAAAEKTGPTDSAPPRTAMKASDLFTNSIVAKGKGFTITRSALDEAMAGIKSQALSRGEVVSPEQLNLLERQILQRLIQVQLLSAKATDADKSAGKELAEQRLTEIKMRAGGTDEALEQQLKPLGMNRSEFVAKVTEEAIAETVLKRELKVQVSPDAIKSFYDGNRSKFEQPEMVRAAHILFGTRDLTTQIELSDAQKATKRKLAEDVMKRARGGEDFAKLAKEYSEDPGSKDKGGEYTFPRGQMVPEFESAAFSMTTNQVSDIVTTAFGYHIIKLYEKVPARTAVLDDEVTFGPGYVIIKKYWNGPPENVKSAMKLSEVIRQKLEADEQQKQIPDYMDKLVKDGNVEIPDENLRPMPPALRGTNTPPPRMK
jgi:peptidyl-prolyl cis-trans isomerase C